MRKKIFFLIPSLYFALTGASLAMCGGGVALYEKGPDGWYYGRTKLIGADAASFHVMSGEGSNPTFNPCMRDSGYAMDSFHVYRGAAALPGADPATFKLLDSGYARDATHVYYLEKTLDGADTKTFTQVSWGFYRDASHVYLNGAAINDADPATFSALGDNAFPGSGVAKDGRHVFFGAEAIPAADPKDVKPLGNQYWKSNRVIFFADKPLTPVDPPSFSVASENELAFSAEDRDRFFMGNTVYNKADCRKVGEIVLACKNFIVTRGRLYAQINPAAIHYLGRFPPGCQVIEGSLIYQDDRGIYEFYGDGTIMKFMFQPDRQFNNLDKTVQDLLCSHPVTQSL